MSYLFIEFYPNSRFVMWQVNNVVSTAGKLSGDQVIGTGFGAFKKVNQLPGMDTKRLYQSICNRARLRSLQQSISGQKHIKFVLQVVDEPIV